MSLNLKQMKLVFNLLKLPLCFKCQKMHLAITSTIQNTPLLLWDYSPQSWAIIKRWDYTLEADTLCKTPLSRTRTASDADGVRFNNTCIICIKRPSIFKQSQSLLVHAMQCKLLLVITGNLDRWQFSVYACNLQLNLAVFFLAPAASKNTCIKHTQDTKRTVNWEFSIKVLHWKTFTISGWSSTSHKIWI